MAHLLVSREMIIEQENYGQQRPAKKHRRSDEVPLVTLTSESKRRALASITNQPPARENQTVVAKHCSRAVVKRQEVQEPHSTFQTTLDHLFLPLSSSSFLCPSNDILPIGREVNLSTCSSNTASSTAASFCLSSSFRSLGSPTTCAFGSPMLLSSPDSLSSSLMCTEFIDIDLLEDDNCAVCGEYTSDIFTYLREAEVRFHPKPNYMNKQPDITGGMRAILVDWLVEVADEFRMDPQTFYLTISISDRFLSCMSVMRSKLQLVGAASMYIASKFEEIFPPELGDFAFITDDTYTKQQIVRMERLILQVLDFNLVAPTPQTFLLRYLKATEAEQLQTFREDSVQMIGQTIEALAKYLCELAIQDADPYLKYYPSVIAASAVCLARHTMGQLAWPPILQHYSGYMVTDIGNCLQDLHRTFAMAPRHSQQAIRQKYCSEKYMKVSTLKAPETLPC